MSEWAWTDEEELLIATIEENESVQRAEAIRRMQRRKKSGRIKLGVRICQNPRCTNGERCGPNSLTHLRVDARYCDTSCKKAASAGPAELSRSRTPAGRVNPAEAEMP